MTTFLQATAAVLITAVLVLTLSKQGKETATVLIIAVCCMIAVTAVGFFRPVIGFLEQLEALADETGDMLGVLLKIVGIGLISEIAAMVCADSGSGSLGKMLQLLGNAVMLWLSIPVFNALLELIRQILGGL